MPLPFTIDADGATLTIRVTPKASRTEARGTVAIEGNAAALSVRIAAPPVDGAANDELLRFLAKRLGVGRTALTLMAGQTSRVKRVRVSGVTEATLLALIGTA